MEWLAQLLEAVLAIGGVLFLIAVLAGVVGFIIIARSFR